jgi:hypothetical protein
VRTLVAVATGSGRIAIRVLTGAVLGVFVVAYAAVSMALLPIVAAVLGIATLIRRIVVLVSRASGRTVGARIAIRSAVVGWLSLGR